MQTLNVRELRSAIPHLRETLEREHELLLISNGEPVARILPVRASPVLESLAAFRATLGRTLPDSTPDIREERDKR